MKRAFLLSLKLLLLLFVFNSCLNNDDYIDRRAYGDAIIRAFQQADSVIYGVQLYVYSSVPMQQVSAFAQNIPDSVIQLDSTLYRYTFTHLSELSTYTTKIPDAQRYLFDVSFAQTDVLRVSDYLDTAVVAPPVINKAEWNNDFKRIEIEWERNTKTQYYKVLLSNTNNEIVFETPLLNGVEKNLQIDSFTYGWLNNKAPLQDTILRVQINAYLFEPVATTFDLQCIATNNLHTVEWKVE